MLATNKKRMSTQTMVLAAILTAFVIVLQLIGTFTAWFGPFSTAVALVPIVIGAAMCGVGVGAWLGFVFGCVVLLSGGATFFLAVDIPGTIITVLCKGTFCGLAAGLVFQLLKKLNRYVAVFAAAITAPVVNTGIFLLGCLCFFMDNVIELGGTPEAGFSIFITMALANFLFELGMSLVLAPVIVRILNIKKNW